MFPGLVKILSRDRVTIDGRLQAIIFFPLIYTIYTALEHIFSSYQSRHLALLAVTW